MSVVGIFQGEDTGFVFALPAGVDMTGATGECRVRVGEMFLGAFPLAMGGPMGTCRAEVGGSESAQWSPPEIERIDVYVAGGWRKGWMAEIEAAIVDAEGRTHMVGYTKLPLVWTVGQ